MITDELLISFYLAARPVTVMPLRIARPVEIRITSIDHALAIRRYVPALISVRPGRPFAIITIVGTIPIVAVVIPIVIVVKP